jgi:hypothetical protein
MQRIYVASSWRNDYQPIVVETLRAIGHEVYDFKNPPNERAGFSWREVDPNWENWTTAEYANGLTRAPARAGFESDLSGMQWATGCVLVLPSGRSAHLEAGWFMGRGLPVEVYVPSPERIEPELMYLLAGEYPICWDLHALKERVALWGLPRPRVEKLALHQAKLDGMHLASRIARECNSGYGAAHFIDAERQRLDHEGPQ